MIKDGTELHLLASFCLVNAELRLTGANDSDFMVFKVQYAAVLGWVTPAPPDHS